MIKLRNIYRMKNKVIIAALLLSVMAGSLVLNEIRAQAVVYNIGDTGPAGGIIFYDKGNYAGGWRYLEAAPEDQSTGAEWGCYKKAIPGKQGTAIGTGKNNTQEIIRSCGEENIAAKVAGQYNGGGKKDWFLPSKDELNALYENLKKSGLGGLADYGYWSSTEDSDEYAWYHGFVSGQQKKFNKYNSSRVRAIRSF